MYDQDLIDLGVYEFTSTMELLLQQQTSRLRVGMIERAAYGTQSAVINQFVPVSARVVTDRFADLVPVGTQNDRRWAQPTDFDLTDWISTFDQLRLNLDPTGEYVQNFIEAMGRSMDDIIIASFGGNAATGQFGTNVTPFPASQQVPVATGAGGPTGMNVDKLKIAMQILRANEVDLATTQVYCVISAKQYTDLYQEIQMINADYLQNFALGGTQLPTFMGITFLHSERLATDVNGYRDCYLWGKQFMTLAIWDNVTCNVTRLWNKTSQPYQVYAKMTIGATRTQEKGVVQLPCLES